MDTCYTMDDYRNNNIVGVYEKSDIPLLLNLEESNDKKSTDTESSIHQKNEPIPL